MSTLKQIIVATSAALSLSAGTAQAAFTSLTDGNYRMQLTSGCFIFGNCQADGGGAFVDNGEVVSGIGSSIGGDGVMGIIDFTLTGGNLSVTSFAQDAYLSTAGGTFAIRDIVNGAGMSGNIDASGNMTFDPTGRSAITSAFAASVGEQPWNIDDSDSVPGGTGQYELWTTGASSNRTTTSGAGFTMNGIPLQDAGAGNWTGTLVSAGNTGRAWGLSNGVRYSELFNVQISAVPVPAAVWLFVSGLAGLAGIARYKQPV